MSKVRYVPSYFTKFKSIENIKLETYIHTAESGKTSGMGFSGNRSKPDFHYSFKTVDEATAWIEKYIANVVKATEAKKEVKEIRKKERKEQVITDWVSLGDIFHYSWGYEQTQCEFFQVTNIGKKTVELTPIACEMTRSNGSMSGYFRPVKNDFCVSRMNPILVNKRVTGTDKNPYIRMPHGYAYKCDETAEKYCSWYA